MFTRHTHTQRCQNTVPHSRFKQKHLGFRAALVLLVC